MSLKSIVRLFENLSPEELLEEGVLIGKFSDEGQKIIVSTTSKSLPKKEGKEVYIGPYIDDNGSTGFQDVG